MSLMSHYIPFLLIAFVFLQSSHAALFEIVNQCPYTVWAAAVPGGGRELPHGHSWALRANPGLNGGRIWARTNCNFAEDGRGRCQTGDCGGFLECTSHGAPPHTMVEYVQHQYNEQDMISISLFQGYNVPIDITPIQGCAHGVRCSADIVARCPLELRAPGGWQMPGGCNSACPVFRTEEFCCTSGNCGPNKYSRFFKGMCPQASTYSNEDASISCPAGTTYRVTFCP